MSVINFFSADYNFNLKHKKAVRNWLLSVSLSEQFSILELNYIFCSDDYLLKINIDYLNHNFFTDVITFNNSSSKLIEGDIFISIPRIIENASSFGTLFIDELHRVMVHGFLHLLGFDDKVETSKAIMTAKEDFYLSLRRF